MEGSGRRRAAAVVACACVLSLVGCSDEPAEEVAQDQGDHTHGHSHSTGPPTENFKFTLGVPGNEADATRTVEVEAVEGFRFSPAQLSVDAGETVTFEVTNSDNIPHEFILGNAAYQELHNNQMNAGGVYHDYSAYSVHVNPGDTLGLTWTFQESGRVEFACHVDGHYDQGMIGRIAIS